MNMQMYYAQCQQADRTCHPYKVIIYYFHTNDPTPLITFIKVEDLNTYIHSHYNYELQLRTARFPSLHCSPMSLAK